MKWKCIIIGGLVFWLVANVLSFATGPIIHQGALDADYRANSAFWRPELSQDPPDMAALMPVWLLNSLIVSLIVAWLYCRCRCGDGPGWRRGMGFCLGLGIFACGSYLAMSGVFNLPSRIWIFWGIEALIIYLVAGAAMGWAVGKWGE
jgi:hypothetical protein